MIIINLILYLYYIFMWTTFSCGERSNSVHLEGRNVVNICENIGVFQVVSKKYVLL